MSGTEPRQDRLTAYERDLIAEIRRLAPVALASPDSSAEFIHMAALAAHVADIAARLAAGGDVGESEP